MNLVSSMPLPQELPKALFSVNPSFQRQPPVWWWQWRCRHPDEVIVYGWLTDWLTLPFRTFIYLPTWFNCSLSDDLASLANGDTLLQEESHEAFSEDESGARAQAVAAKEAQRALAGLSGEERSTILRAVAAGLIEHQAEVGTNQGLLHL